MNVSGDDLIRFEQAAAALARGLSGDFPQWSELIAVAQAAIGSVQSASPDISGIDPVLKLQVASRILSSAASNGSLVPAPDKARLRLLAAATFTLQGNHPSANATIKPLLDTPEASLSEIEWAICAILSPMHSGRIRQLIQSDDLLRILDLHAQSTLTGSVGASAQVHDELGALFARQVTSFEAVALGLAIDSLATTLDLSVARIVHEYNLPIPEAFLEGLHASGVFTFMPPQKSALLESDLLQSSGNALLSMPTSSGKTLLAELTLLSALQTKGTWGCYVTPYVALGSQVVRTLRSRNSGIEVIAALGGYIDDTAPALTDEGSVIVATPERLDSILRNSPDLLDSLSCIVFDEAHIVQSGPRGARLEGLITRLRMQQSRGRCFRIVLVSAVLDDSSALIDWLGGPANVVQVRSTWRPTTRRIFYWDASGALNWMAEAEGLRTPAQPPGTTLASTMLPWPRPNIYATDKFGAQKAQRSSIAENTAYLVRYLLGRQEGAILCICATKASTRVLARALADTLPEMTGARTASARILDLIESRFPHLADLARAVQRGVAYHNSTLPSIIKQRIEEAVREGELLAVAATTTLAEGVDLPFRYTVLHEWQMWESSDAVQPINQLLFRNIAGRSGRAGAHTDGDVYVWENPGGNSQFSRSSVIRRHLVEAVIPSTPISLRSPLEGATNEQTSAMIASQFLAAVPENSDEDQLENVLYLHSYSSRRTQSQAQLQQQLRRARFDLLDNAEGALGVAASPIRLTPLGGAVLATGLSPQTGRSLLSALRHMPDDLPAPESCAYLLRSLASAPEQSNTGLRKKLTTKGSRYPISGDDLEFVIASWLGGVEPRDIFLQLPYVTRSKRAGLAGWASGQTENEGWSEEFDKIADFIDSTCVNFLPWILRASGSFTTLSTDASAAQIDDWAGLADFLEHGVNSRWALELVRRSARLPRSHAVRIAPALEAAVDVDPTIFFMLGRQARVNAAASLLEDLQSDVENAELVRALFG